MRRKEGERGDRKREDEFETPLRNCAYANREHQNNNISFSVEKHATVLCVF